VPVPPSGASGVANLEQGTGTIMAMMKAAVEPAVVVG
jgi:hypothetical protein